MPAQERVQAENRIQGKIFLIRFRKGNRAQSHFSRSFSCGSSKNSFIFLYDVDQSTWMLVSYSRSMTS